MPYSIKFDTLKSKALLCLGAKFASSCGFNSDIAVVALMAAVEANCADWRQQYENLYEACRHRIDNWDVRCVTKLIAAFPGIVPQRCRDRVPSCYIEDSDASPWICAWE